jgi:hypothetical protein
MIFPLPTERERMSLPLCEADKANSAGCER